MVKGERVRFRLGHLHSGSSWPASACRHLSATGYGAAVPRGAQRQARDGGIFGIV